MPQAARVGDATSHPGVLMPVGHPTVTIDGLSSCTLGDTHTCTIHPKCNPIFTGSPTVFIGGLQAARMTDFCECMSTIVAPCSPFVLIGGAPTQYLAFDTQNCYGYATVMVSLRQPGETSGNPIYQMKDKSLEEIRKVAEDLNVTTVRNKLVSDLGPMADPNAPVPPGTHKVMFFNTPDVDPTTFDPKNDFWDFHVYRQDPDGYWSQKNGRTSVKRFDASCSPIVDPMTADRRLLDSNGQVIANYTEYVGTWIVPDDPK